MHYKKILPTRLRCAHKIAFSNLHPALANDVVSRRGVEVKVGQAIAEQEALARELPRLPAWEGNADVFSLGAVDLALGDALEGNRWSWQSDLSVEQSWSRRWQISKALYRINAPPHLRRDR